ncbi:DUF3560 domain-containing protein [Aeromonas hydrophila]
MSATVISMDDFNAAKNQQQADQHTRRPVSVLVHSSESAAWSDQQRVTFADFEKEAMIAALGHAGRGYLKTHVTVTLSDGHTVDLRLDLAASGDLGIADHCLSTLKYAETEEGRQRLADYPEHMREAHVNTLAYFSGIDFGMDDEGYQAARMIAVLAEIAAVAEQEKAAKAESEAQEKAAEAAAAAEAARLAAGAPEYAHLVPLGEQDTGGVAAAKNVRRDLKKAFPGVKFSVKSNYSTVNVSWQDGPTRKEVDALIGKFEQGRFDGMTDGYEYNTSAFNNMYGAVQYTFTSRAHSEELRAVATRLIEQQSGEKVTGESHQQIWGEWASVLVGREAARISMKSGVWHHDGAPIEWRDEVLAEPLVEVVPAGEALVVPAAGPQDKPNFSPRRIGSTWSVTIAQGGQTHQFDGIVAASPAEACRIAWAMLTQPTPPDDDPSGEPLPVEPVVELVTSIEPGATAPTLTRAQTLGDYHGRVEHKRERLKGRACLAASQSAGRHVAVRAILSFISPGQPILVGHHSERRHRRDLKRMDQHMEKAVALANKANYLEERAASVGQGGIASDNPGALVLLQAKLARREARQQAMKEANKATRGTYKGWQLSNNSAEIRRLRQRIEQLETLHGAAPLEQVGAGWQMFEDDGRIQIHFDGKPAPELRQLCKGAGFVWSPSRCAWVRKVTARAVNEARRLARALPTTD